MSLGEEVADGLEKKKSLVKPCRQIGNVLPEPGFEIVRFHCCDLGQRVLARWWMGLEQKGFWGWCLCTGGWGHVPGRP